MTASLRKPPMRLAGVALAAAGLLAGCSTIDIFSGDKIDYRSQASKTAALDVPPDLTQLAQDSRYQSPGGVVNASTMRPGAVAGPTVAAGPGANTVAPAAMGEVRILRDGQTRWLSSPEPPEKLFPLLRSFWTERGFAIETDSPELGLLETAWAENRAKLPQDIVRRTIGRVFDSLFSTAERDRFRTRVERSANGGSEVYIVHRGMVEVYESNVMRDRTVWQPRPRDPELEAEFLARLMVRLGSKEDVARSAVAAAAVPAPLAAGASPSGIASGSRALPAQANLDLAEGFDRAWRMVGLALDRSGFSVEDRDRSAGLYFVRYIDKNRVGQDEPNFFQRLLRSADKDSTRPTRYRVQVKANGNRSTVTVLDAQGATDNSEAARQIVARLADELR